MYKRIIALVLCVALCMSILPVTAFAAESKEDKITKAITSDYKKILRNCGRSSLSGYCGLMASWQLYFLGVNNWVVSYHGKNQFDAYKNVAMTSGGHRVRAYAASEMGLKDALLMLSKNGTYDVYNILVGFQKTNTRLGRYYGHSVVIYAILDGIVYFTEGYTTPYGGAGRPMKLTIEKFAKYYNQKGQYEGVIYFGRKGYVANCNEYATNMYAEVTASTPMYTDPCVPGTADSDSEFVRTVNYGERLWINAMYENPQGEFYYQLGDEGGYINAADARPFYFVYDDIGISNAQNPADMKLGKTSKIKGRVASEFSTMGAVRMVVTDGAGEIILNHALAKLSGVYDLESDTFSYAVKFNYLDEGSYIYHIYADGLNFYLKDGQVQSDSREILLVRSPFRVGEAETLTVEEIPEAPPENTDGWVYTDGTWYCYKDDQPRTGWYCYHGGDYYLKEDGSVTTGWVEINGKMRLFSETGSMRTGWLDTEEGRMYLQFNGAPATGTRTIDGEEYQFDENGCLLNNAEL